MNYAYMLSLGLVAVAACSSSDTTGPTTTNEPGSASRTVPPNDDGDSGPVTSQDPSGDTDQAGDTATGGMNVPPPPEDGGGEISKPPPVTTAPTPEPKDPAIPPSTGKCAVTETDVPLQLPWRHWPEGVPIVYDQNPPAGGQSYEMWAQYREYTDPILDRGHWNHNLRHGAIVMVYRPDAPADIIAALRAALPVLPTPGGKFNANPACPRMGILTPDPLMDDTYAVLAWGKMLTSKCAPDVADIVDFAKRHVFEAPEKECFDGDWPTRGPCYRYETVRDYEWSHEVPEGSAVTYADYPPSSGPFYPKTLAYGRYDTYVPAPYWTKILAKGGVVVLYRPDASPVMVASLKAAYDALTPHWECGIPMTAMVQDPNLKTPYAAVAQGNYMGAQCFEGWELNMFVTSRRGWGALESCDDGTYVPK